MILACAGCQRQIAVSAFETGAKVRCFCGELNVVPARTALSRRMMNCGQCGAALPEREPKCSYCGAVAKRSDRGLGDACPTCFTRLAPGARYCSSCGEGIAPQAVLSALSSTACPCCKATLAECRSGEIAFVECTGCGGLWLEKPVFQRLLSEARARDPATPAFREPVRPVSDSKPAAAPLYRPCPTCRDMMPRSNFGQSGVIVDWCGRHGFWFDADELAQILRLGREGKLKLERAPELDKARPSDYAWLERQSDEPKGLASVGAFLLETLVRILT